MRKRIITSGETYGLEQFKEASECDLLYITDLYQELDKEEINKVQYRVFIGDDMPPKNIFFHHEVDRETFTLNEDDFREIEEEVEKIIAEIEAEKEADLSIPEEESEAEAEDSQHYTESEIEKDYREDISKELKKLQLFETLMGLVLDRLESGEKISNIKDLKITIDNVVDIIKNYADYYINMKVAQDEAEKAKKELKEQNLIIDELRNKLSGNKELRGSIVKDNKAKEEELARLRSELKTYTTQIEKDKKPLPTLSYYNLNKLDSGYKRVLYFREFSDVTFFNTFIEFLKYHISKSTDFNYKLLILENPENQLRHQYYPNNFARLDSAENFQLAFKNSDSMLMTRPTGRRLEYIYKNGSADEVLIIVDRYYKGQDAISGAIVTESYVTNNEQIMQLNDLKPVKVISNRVKDSFILKNFNTQDIAHFNDDFNDILNKDLQYRAFYKEVVENFLKRRGILGYTLEGDKKDG